MSDLSQPSSVEVERLLNDIETVVRIESPTGDASGVNAVLDAVAGQFANTPFVVERIPTSDGFGDCLRVTSGDRSGASNLGILVLSHADTVHPRGTLHGALPCRREGDRFYGPGIYDMKAGFMIAVAALLRAAERGSLSLPVTFLLTPDEEVGSPVSRALIEAEARRARYVLVTEPARDGGKIVTARKGVGRFRITTQGRPAHAGTGHQKGRSAIRAMARLILEIEGFTDYARGVTTNVGLISGGTGVNVIPEHCSIEADLRVCDEATGHEMEARFHALTTSEPDVTVAVEGGMNRPPFERDAGIDALFGQAAQVADGLGFTLESVPMTGGGSDGNFTAAMGIPTLDGLGVDGDGAHTNHEHILVSSVAERVCLMQGLIETLR